MEVTLIMTTVIKVVEVVINDVIDGDDASCDGKSVGSRD